MSWNSFSKCWNSFSKRQNCLVPHFLCKEWDGFRTKKACSIYKLKKMLLLNTFEWCVGWWRDLPVPAEHSAVWKWMGTLLEVWDSTELPWRLSWDGDGAPVMISEPLLPPLLLHVKYRLGMITLQAKQTYLGLEAICLEGKSITLCCGNIICSVDLLFDFGVQDRRAFWADSAASKNPQPRFILCFCNYF